MISVGQHALLPDTPGQTVEIFVSGGFPVQGMNFNLQIADGGPTVGGSVAGPAIANLDILTGTIFATNNTGTSDQDGPFPDPYPQIEWRSTTTMQATVAAEGLLATVTIDTTGWSSGSWVLSASETLNGSTDFTLMPAVIFDGAIIFATENHAPVANPQAVTTSEDTAKAITLTGADIDGDPLSYAVVTPPAHGTLSGTAPNVTYTPAANYFGSDSFTFRVNDGSLNSAVATVGIAVASVNDAPVADPQSVTTNEDTAKAITLTGSDLEGDPLSYAVVTPPAHGTLSGTAPNVTYTPAANYFGSDSFTFRVNDGALDSAVAMVSITVERDDTPVASSSLVVLANDLATNSKPYVTVLDSATGTVKAKFLAYEATYTGGVRVATGDLDGDGLEEIITAPGKSHVPEIRVFSRAAGDGSSWYERVEFRLLAYAAGFSGGVQIDVGDVDGDQLDDLVATPGYGAATTRVFLNQYDQNPAAPFAATPSVEFFAFGSAFTSGSVVKLSDWNLDGRADVVVGNAGGMRTTVRVFDVGGTPTVIRTFLPFAEAFRGGVSIDLGDITGDGVPDLIAGAGLRGQCLVEVFDGASGTKLTSFTAYGSSPDQAVSPVRVAARDTDGDGRIDQIVTAQGIYGKTNEIRSFDLVYGAAGHLNAVLDPWASVDLDSLGDPDLLGGYFLDVLK